MRRTASLLLALVFPLSVSMALACPMGARCPMRGEARYVGCHALAAPSPPDPCCDPDQASPGKEAAARPLPLLGATLPLLPVLQGEGALSLAASPPARPSPLRAHGAQLLSLLDCYLI